MHRIFTRALGRQEFGFWKRFPAVQKGSDWRPAWTPPVVRGFRFRSVNCIAGTRRRFCSSSNSEKGTIGTKKDGVKISGEPSIAAPKGVSASHTTFAGSGPIKWSGLAASLALFAAMVLYFTREKKNRMDAIRKRNARSIGRPLLGGPWTLVDQNGRAVTDATLRENGHTHALLYFGFTFCPDICPAELIKMKEVIDKLDQMPDIGPCVRPVFISVDPNRDGVAQIAHYVKDFHPRMLGLTGTPGQVRDACQAYRVYHSVADRESEDDYLVDHSIVMYLIGPDGLFLDFYTQMAEVDECVARIRDMILNPPQYEDETEDEKESSD